MDGAKDSHNKVMGYSDHRAHIQPGILPRGLPGGGGMGTGPESGVGICQVGKGILGRGIFPKAQKQEKLGIFGGTQVVYSDTQNVKYAYCNTSDHTELPKVERQTNTFAPMSMTQR